MCLQVAGRIAVPGQVLQQALLEQAVEDRVGDLGRDRGRRSGELGVLAHDPPDHPLQALVAATAEASRHGWHHTGDIGYLDADNYLYIVDRAKDMIITGGFNVYSAEVEQALMAHPAVRDCAVIGLPDDKWGERVTAVVQIQPGHPAAPDALKAFVRERIGSVKTPKQIEIWPDLPRSRVGKVLKNEIKARLLPAPAPGQDR